jgi:hypothetical protein
VEVIFVTSCLPQSLLAEARLALAMDESKAVQKALHLGWCVAETRGRNWPGGPPGGTDRMPDHNDHALPLRMERTATELRIEAQAVVAALAKELHVDDAPDGGSFGGEIDHLAKLLAHVRTPKVVRVFDDAVGVLQRSPDGYAPATELLQAGVTVQQGVVAEQQQAVTAARRVLTAARERRARAARQPAGVATAAVSDATDAEAAVRLADATCTAETKGLTALTEVIEILGQASGTAGTAGATQAAATAMRAHLLAVSAAAQVLWAQLAELIWQFDAHIQDTLSAASEDQATAYQLGRGLAETYWALDPDRASGSAGWTFLLGDERCGELSRLAGRLSAYMCEYTAPAIAGSVEVWHDVAKTPAWRAGATAADQALYRQIRRWYELIILGQDPTTLIKPGAILKDYRTLGRALRLFWPQLAAVVVGLAALVTLLVLLGVGGSAWQKTLSGLAAAVGLSLAGISGTLKNSAQAVLKRLRQDAYSDLVAFAVQTSPPPPKKSDIRRAIARRELTTATPN